MGVFPKKTSTRAEQPVKESPVADEKALHSENEHSINELINKDAQAGVQKAEAVTAVWSKTHLVLAYLLSVFSARCTTWLADRTR